MGLRERKKRETKRRLGDVAARLFAENGYDAVSVSEIARAAEVADQTVYNYFPTKPDLVLDRSDEILERSQRLIADRDPSQTPADVLRDLAHEDIDRFRDADLTLAPGEFPALCLTSGVLRRFALEFRTEQAAAISVAIAETDPELHPLIIRAGASALIAIIQDLTDRVGAAILAGANRDEVALELRTDTDIAFADAAENFRAAKQRARKN